jgi:hypothetical protein
MIQVPVGGVASIAYNLNGPFVPHSKIEIVVFQTIAIKAEADNDGC